ncbi:hypothetical protein [Halorarum salinum]|uniref:Uncharacterized protein n=1 Tax=Halorarum salinum TaxID=2743089 RepID=A0A7D5L9F5_9EURY|nr:hypothetical protein [Halobaculum salinum]QLG61446.1 hypothetical protein HUG12_06730 [Halobaculum salinum]
MKPHEIAFLEEIADNRSASIASAMRDGTADVELVESESRLTVHGRLWVRGYLTDRFSMYRAGTTGNPNLTAEDLERIAEFVDEHQAGFAAELYS